MIGRRLRWMAVGGAVGLVARSRVERAVAEEARRLPHRLPVASPLLDRLPPDAARVAGAAVVAGRTAIVGGRVGYRAAVLGGRGARTAGTAAGVAGRVVARGGGAAHGAVVRARDELERTRAAWVAAARDEERWLRADLARLDGDPSGALDALLDRRPIPAPPVDVPPVPAPVPVGRNRATAPAPAPGGRVQRTYRATPPPWSSPAR